MRKTLHMRHLKVLTGELPDLILIGSSTATEVSLISAFWTPGILRLSPSVATFYKLVYQQQIP